MKSSKIKIILVEDHISARQAYSRVIEDEVNLSVIGEASNGAELLDLLKESLPDVILLDLEMPVLNGYKTLPILKVQYPEIKVIVLSTHNEAYLVASLLQNGANSFLPKNCSLEDIILAINKVYLEGYFFDASISKLIVKDLITNSNSLRLSDQEIKVLKLFCDGKSYKEIAESLYISLNTVKFHLKNIYKKTEMPSIASLVKYAIRNGITEVA